MTALGIVGCRVFEDEITHVLANGPDIEDLHNRKRRKKQPSTQIS